MLRRIPSGCVVVLVLLVCVFCLADSVRGQAEPAERDYRYKVGDTVNLSVPVRPSLNGELVLNGVGAVDLPLIGSVDVAGLTLEEMQAKIYQALRDLYPSLARTDVILEPVYAVYVTGAVSAPGRYRFPGSPRVWDAIQKAGGPLGDAMLDMVRIVDADADSSQSRVVNVLKALELGTVDELPLLGKESTVVIPSGRELYTGSFGVNVFGAVAKPGFYRLAGEHQDVMGAILLAGGPTPRASLDRVKILRRAPDGSMISQDVNLNKYLKAGDPNSNPSLRGGDTVSVGEKSSISYQLQNNTIGIMFSFIAATCSILLVYDQFVND